MLNQRRRKMLNQPKRRKRLRKMLSQLRRKERLNRELKKLRRVRKLNHPRRIRNILRLLKMRKNNLKNS